MNTPAEGSDNWRRFISRAFWPAAVLLLVFTFRSEIADRLKHITHMKAGSFEADVNQGRVSVAIRDVLRSVYERHDDPGRAQLDAKSFDQLVRLFATLDLDRLAQKRVLWVNAHPSEEDLDLANAFTALDVQVFHARSNCSAKRLLSQDRYSVIITNMWRPKDDSDIANCARNIELPPENAPPDIKYPGGFQFLEYMLDKNPNHTPVVVYSSWKPDVSEAISRWRVAGIFTEPADTYEFVLRTLSRD